MSKGISRRVKKLSRFLDNGGIILKVKLKGKPSDTDNYIRKFHEVNVNKPQTISIHWYNHLKSSHIIANQDRWRCPVLNITVKNWGSPYYKNPYIDVHWGICDIRYMLVLYPDGVIKTIWI